MAALDANGDVASIAYRGTGPAPRVLLDPGDYMMTITVADSDGATASAERSLRILRPAPTLDVAATPLNVDLETERAHYELAATLRDADGNNVAANIVWREVRCSKRGSGLAS